MNPHIKGSAFIIIEYFTKVAIMLSEILSFKTLNKLETLQSGLCDQSSEVHDDKIEFLTVFYIELLAHVSSLQWNVILQYDLNGLVEISVNSLRFFKNYFFDEWMLVECLQMF